MFPFCPNPREGFLKERVFRKNSRRSESKIRRPNLANSHEVYLRGRGGGAENGKSKQEKRSLQGSEEWGEFAWDDVVRSSRGEGKGGRTLKGRRAQRGNGKNLG